QKPSLGHGRRFRPIAIWKSHAPASCYQPDCTLHEFVPKTLSGTIASATREAFHAHLEHEQSTRTSSMSNPRAPRAWALHAHLEHQHATPTSSMSNPRAPRAWALHAHLEHGRCTRTSSLSFLRAP